jgi:hypothetical protein
LAAPYLTDIAASTITASQPTMTSAACTNNYFGVFFERVRPHFTLQLAASFIA